MKRHIVLVGLPGSGKSTVGPLVAQQLGGTFVDVDAVIVRREGKPVPVIFAEQGEAAFRTLERNEMTAQLAKEPPAILAPGGGWAAQPGALEAARPRAFLIYLRAQPDTAVDRAEPQGIGNRPTLTGETPEDEMVKLLAEREPFYKLADAEVNTERQTAESVAEAVVKLARAQAGW